MAPHATSDFTNQVGHWSDQERPTGQAPMVGDYSSPPKTERLEPIAVVGLSLKFPQVPDSADAFWDLLMHKRCTATDFPPDRLSVSALYHPDPSRRSTTSVYTGCFTNDWQQLCFKDPEQTADHAGIGVESCMNANRISWFFDSTGSSVNVDTACSSSIVALDLACQSLMNRDANMSIAAGCNLIFSPDLMHALSNMSMLSPDNQYYSFDHRANGYARGEGFSVLVLKRLQDAISDNDTIRGVIRATGANQDGYTQGITQPSSISQEAVIRETYDKAGLSMGETRFFEAHGTGIAIGDPIETTALGKAFRKVRSLEEPLLVGAVKANIGHLKGASGIAGVIKTIMVLERAIIPPNINFECTNPRIDTEFLRIKFPCEPTAWPCRGIRRASVNSFDFGGTNAQVILDDACHYLHNGKGGEARQCTRSAITVVNSPDFLTRVLAYGAFKPITRTYFHALLKYYCNPELPLLDAEQSQCLVGATSSTPEASKDLVDHKILFAQSDSLVDAARVVSDALIKKLSRAMAVVNSEVDIQKPLSVHGVDSLLAVELRSWMAKEFGADVPVFEILGASSTLSSLSMSIAAKSRLRRESWDD
ncbi:reducing polyketide synthase pksF [Physcia stellaris]|nr:reducing polyketide synthase pksF [Physcia stellaris]